MITSWLIIVFMKTLVAKRATLIDFIPLVHYLQACLLPLITFFHFKFCSPEICLNNNNKIQSKILTDHVDRASIFLSSSLQHVIKMYSGKRKGCSCWSGWLLYPGLVEPLVVWGNAASKSYYKNICAWLADIHYR